MKTPSIITLGAFALLSASCGSFPSFGGPLNSSFDPLSSPGSKLNTQPGAMVAQVNTAYKAGQWVETSMPDAAFFRSIPKGNASAQKVLPISTPLKVVASEGTYLKVELDSGEVGYVPEIMVIERGASQAPAVGPDYGPIPPPVDPALGTSGDTFSPPPLPEGIPGSTTLVPTPSGNVVPPLPNGIPTVPDVVAPPTVPGITD